MSLNLNIIQVLEITSIWPGKDNAKKVICLASDNTQYEATIHSEEVDLVMYLKYLKSNTDLNQQQLGKLSDLISNYGSQKYSEGGLDSAMNSADY